MKNLIHRLRRLHRIRGVLDAGVLGPWASISLDRALRLRSAKQPEQFREVSVSRGGPCNSEPFAALKGKLREESLFRSSGACSTTV